MTTVRVPGFGSDGLVPEVGLSPDARVTWLDEHRAVLIDGDLRVPATVFVARDVTYVSVRGCTYEVREDDAATAAAHTTGSETAAVSPMTGVLAKLHVTSGQAVASGEPLFVVEAMKMEYVVRAPRDVTVDAVQGAEGEQVELGAEVVTFASENVA